MPGSGSIDEIGSGEGMVYRFAGKAEPRNTDSIAVDHGLRPELPSLFGGNSGVTSDRRVVDWSAILSQFQHFQGEFEVVPSAHYPSQVRGPIFSNERDATCTEKRNDDIQSLNHGPLHLYRKTSRDLSKASLLTSQAKSGDAVLLILWRVVEGLPPRPHC